MPIAILSILFACTVGISLLFSMLGMGGGIIYTPLQLFFDIPFHQAAPTSLFLIMVTSFSATLVYRAKNKIDWRLALTLESTAFIGAFIGGYYAKLVSAEVLSACLAGIILISAMLMMTELRPHLHLERAKWRKYHWKRQLNGEQYSINLFTALPLVSVAGLMSGLFGIGGGIMKIPMMVLLFGIPMDIAVGTSTLMFGLTAAGGLLGHTASANTDWSTALSLGLAALIGAQIGAHVSVRVDKQRLRKGFGFFLILIAIALLVSLRG